jgi:hypothetical protein
MFDPGRYRLDLSRAPLMEVHYAYDPEGDRWIAAWLMHHLIDDNTSLQLLVREVAAHLTGMGLDGPSVPYKNFVAQALQALSLEEHQRFFREMLGEIEEPCAPFGEGRRAERESDPSEAQHRLSADLTRRVKAQARRLGVSAASLFHVAWAQVVSRTSGHADPVFGTVLFGRMRAGKGAERGLGPFINTLPCESSASGISMPRRASAKPTALLPHCSTTSMRRCPWCRPARDSMRACRSLPRCSTTGMARRASPMRGGCPRSSAASSISAPASRAAIRSCFRSTISAGTSG